LARRRGARAGAVLTGDGRNSPPAHLTLALAVRSRNLRRTLSLMSLGALEALGLFRRFIGGQFLFGMRAEHALDVVGELASIG